MDCRKQLFLLLTACIFFTFANTSFAQQQKIYNIGVIVFAQPFLPAVEGLKEGLSTYGYQEGLNVQFDIHIIEKDKSLISGVVTKFINNNYNLIFTTTTPVVMEVKKLTLNKNIPIVFTMVADPVASNVVNSLKQPGGNITGISHIAFLMLPKRLQIFKQAFPDMKNIAVFYNQKEAFLKNHIDHYLKQAASELGVNIIEFHVSSSSEMKKAQSELSKKNIDGLFMLPDPLSVSLFGQLVEISRHKKLPLMVIDNFLLQKGGVIGYSPDFYDIGFQAAFLVNSVFKGHATGKLPVQNPEKIKLSVSMKEINRLGLQISESALLNADQIIR